MLIKDSPTELPIQLDSSSTEDARNTITFTHSGIQFGENFSSFATSLSAAQLYIRSNSVNSDIRLATFNGTTTLWEAMVVKSNGNVGIGTANPGLN